MNDKDKVFLVLFCMVLLTVSCAKNETGWRGTIEVVDGITYVKNPEEGLWDADEDAHITLTEDLQIGEMDGPEEILFVYLTDVVVNTKGDIYVADRQLNEIRKFDKDGEYLMTLGRPGQGPGEFQSLKILAIDAEDNLIAFDGMMGRISRFDKSGELIETTRKLVVESWIEPSKIIAAGNTSVFFGKLNGSLKLFHDFNSDWNLTDSYIDYVFVNNREFEEQNLGFHPGHCVFQTDGDIVYANSLYDNRILVYENRKLTTIISRESAIGKPYVVESFDTMEKVRAAAKEKGYFFSQFGPGGFFTGNLIQRSEGIYILNNGNIVNFLNIMRSKDLYEFGIEVYDPAGKFLIYAKLGENLGCDIRYKDGDDQFYAINRYEFHKVIRFRIEY